MLPIRCPVSADLASGCQLAPVAEPITPVRSRFADTAPVNTPALVPSAFIKNVFKSNFRHVARIPVASGSDQLCLAGSRVWSSNSSFSTLPGVTCCHT